MLVNKKKDIYKLKDMKFFDLILESRVDEFRTKYGNKFTSEQLEKIIDNAPQKFLDWIGKNFDSINFEQNFPILLNSLKEFEKISSNLPLTDIYSYKNISEVAKAIEDYKNKPKIC